MHAIRMFCTLLFFSSTIISAEETEATSLFRFISQSQLSEGSDERAYGMWPIHVYARNLMLEPFVETDFFMPLKTLLSLKRTGSKINLPEMANIEDALLHQAEQYIADTELSGRTEGSVCFWPYRQTPSGESLHNFSVDENVLSWFDDVDLPNDLDTSSRLFRWLLTKDPAHPFISNFIKAAFNNFDSSHGGFNTWVHNTREALPNNIDCVVNMNVIGALAYYKDQFQQSFNDNQLAHYDAACRSINEQFVSNQINECSAYYDRISEIALSFALAVNDGADCLLASKPIIRNHLVTEAERLLARDDASASALAEVALAVHYLAQNDQELKQAWQTILVLLVEKLRAQIVTVDAYSFVKGDSVFIGEFSKDIFDWHSDSYSTALALEALVQVIRI
jgi:hypothetical protein